MTRLVVVAVPLLLAGCDAGAAGASDAGCRSMRDCPDGLACDLGRCIDVCASEPEGTPCNHYDTSSGSPLCCAPGQQCCTVAHHVESCFPVDEPCPVLCAALFLSCPIEQFCLGTCQMATECVAGCAPDRRCGAAECCPDGTHCREDGYCCEPDAVPDAGVPDAVAADAS